MISFHFEDDPTQCPIWTHRNKVQVRPKLWLCRFSSIKMGKKYISDASSEMQSAVNSTVKRQLLKSCSDFAFAERGATKTIRNENFRCLCKAMQLKILNANFVIIFKKRKKITTSASENVTENSGCQKQTRAAQAHTHALTTSCDPSCAMHDAPHAVEKVQINFI